uniref:Glycine receptor subunit beta-type 4-like n=1 Tax=Dermatophagoides pteronyssinus TaxID=6956 RepID=A0A6P6XX84_DERPT|nr:glycine receptor subunit beta-type 4-like [Dermatophagoides pteronyssinus]
MPKTPKLQKHHSKSSSSSSSMMTNSNDGTQTLFELDNEKFGNISMVLASLLDHYDHNQRPGYSGPPAVITTNLEIRSMGPISELDMEYSLDCYFRQKWQDERLRFTGNVDFLSLNIKMLDKIWKPDTYFHTGKASHLHMITTPNKFLRIFKDGLVLYSMRLTIKSLCPMDLHSFPMDKQSCPLILGSYGFPSDQLVYSWDKKPVTFNQKDFTLSQFDIVKTIYRNGTFLFKRGNHSMLQVNFNLRRHVGYFLIQIYVPCSLIVVLSWVSFWINREATSDRVGLGVTAVLTLSTFGLDSRSDLPRVSYATALDWYTVMCFLFVVFTLLEFAGVHYFTKVGTGEVPVIEIDDDWVKSSDDSDNDDYDNDKIFDEIVDHDSDFNEKFQQSCRKRQRQRRRLRRKSIITSGQNYRSRSRIVQQRRDWVNNNKQRIDRTSSSLIKVNYLKPYGPIPKSYQMDHHYPYNMDHQNELNQFQNFPHSLENVTEQMESIGSIVHMPNCPRYQHQQQSKTQENIDWTTSFCSPMVNNDDDYDDDGDDDAHDADVHDQTSSSLKLNSSWPTLGLYNQNLRPNELFENYSTEFLNHRYDEKMMTINNDKDQNDENGDDNNGHCDIDSDSTESDSLSFWLWTRIIHPFSQCCIQFWYCFTANEQFKKEMIKRRTKSQEMCAANSVSMIDKVSRILFPFVFFMLNMAYWTFYINERNSDFIQWEQ